MAIPAFRAAGTAVFSANNVANPTSLSPTKPAAAQNGDLLLLITACRSITATVSTPNGWTLLTGFPKRSATASGGSIYVFARIADGTANDNPTISWSGVTTGTTGDSCSARTHAWQNATVTQDGTVQVSDAASTTSITLPLFATTKAQTLVVGVAIRINDTAHTFTVAAPYTERSDEHTTTGTGHGTEVSESVKASGGNVAATTVTPSNTTSSRTLAVTLGMQAAKTSVTATPATETEAAVGVTKKKRKTVTSATETDVAVARTRKKRVTVTPATETDAVVAVTFQKISHGQTVSVTPAAETDAAIARTVTKKKTATAAAETDSARAVTIRKKKSVVAAVEADTARAARIVKRVSVTPATETDAARALAARKLAHLAPATETNGAVAATARRKVAVSPAAELDAAQPRTHFKSVRIAPATESDAPVTLRVTKRVSVTPALEESVALPPSVTKRPRLTPATETDTAIGITYMVGGTHLVTLTPAVETSTAVRVTARKLHALVPATETDTVPGLRVRKRVDVMPAEELDVAVAATVHGSTTVYPAPTVGSITGISQGDLEHVDEGRLSRPRAGSRES